LDPAAICKSSDPIAVRELLSKVGNKWTIFVVLSLDLLGGRARFSELERAVPAISQRMLSATLKNLERDGLVTRELFAEVPPRVEYEISDLGMSLLLPTQGLRLICRETILSALRRSSNPGADDRFENGDMTAIGPKVR
jgi:DNA-binding HxlR family transcriptional regulator